MNGESFRIILPIKNIKKDGAFNIKISANIDSLSVYNAEAVYDEEEYPNGLQNYAIIIPNENVSEQLTVEYKMVNGHIEITKSDYETKEKLPGAIFSILDENTITVYSSLKTDENGVVVQKNVSPGIYYIEEIKAPIGYQKIKDPVRFELKPNQNLKIVVDNRKIKRSQTTTSEGIINISTSYEENINNQETNKENIVITDKVNVDNKKNEVNNESKTNNTNINNQESIINNIEKNNTINQENIEKINSTVREIEINDTLKEKQKDLNYINSINAKILPITGM